MKIYKLIGKTWSIRLVSKMNIYITIINKNI